jgi:hypothetical protein
VAFMLSLDWRLFVRLIAAALACHSSSNIFGHSHDA